MPPFNLKISRQSHDSLAHVNQALHFFFNPLLTREATDNNTLRESKEKENMRAQKRSLVGSCFENLLVMVMWIANNDEVQGCNLVGSWFDKQLVMMM